MILLGSNVVSFSGRRFIVCKDPFWNRSITWDAKVPTLTSCLKETLIPSCPLVVFLLFSVLDLRIIFDTKAQRHRLPWKWRNVTNLVINSLLILFSVFDLIYRSFKVSHEVIILSYFIHPLVQLLTYSLAHMFALMHRSYGKPISLSLNVLWLFNSLTLSLSVFSHLTSSTNLYSQENLLATIFTIISLLFSVSLVILSSIADEEESHHAFDISHYAYCPVAKYSFVNRLLFCWIFPLIKLASRKKLEVLDLKGLCSYLSSYQSYLAFKKYQKKSYDYTSLVSKPKSISRIVSRTLLWPYLAAICINTIESFVYYIQPFAIGCLISYIGSDEPVWHGYLYTILLFLSVVCSQIISSHSTYLFAFVGLKSISIVNSIVYRKIFNLSPSARNKFNVGKVTNISSINSMDIFWAVFYSRNLFIAPLRIIITIFFLWAYLGVSSLSSLIIIVTLMPFYYLIGKSSSKAQSQRMIIKDKRTNLLNEILNGVKILKLYAWENPFMEKISEIREEELIATRKLCYLDVGFEFFSSLTNVLITCSGFILYLVIDKSHVLDPKTVFVCLSLFNLLKWPFSDLPDTLNHLAKAYTASNRISEFLNAEELPPRVISKPEDPSIHLLISDATFSWDLESLPVLSNLNLNVKKGSLIAIIGRVGAGKSSFLSSIVGDMYCTKGEIKVYGTLAYVSQEAWIQNATVKKNIIFIKDFDQERYDKVIKSCALKPDLDILIAQDETEIGERGVNLSGGQKQRINLARAVYTNSEIYLLDDPLSAVDANVGLQLFNQVIGKNGLLKNKTRLMVTHSMRFLQEVDSIIIFENGQIKAHDTYQNLSSQGLISNVFAKVEASETDKDDNSKSTTALQRHNSIASFKSIDSIESVTPVTVALSSKLIQEEEYSMGKVIWSHYWLYIKSMMISIFVISFVMLCIKNLCDLGSSWWLSVWSSKVNSSVTQDIFIYLTFILASVITFSCSGIILFLGSMKGALTIHFNLLSAILRCPLTFFETTPVGRILNRFSSDIEAIDVIIPYALFNFLSMITYNILAIGFICFKFTYLLILVVIIFIIQTYITKIYTWTSRQLKRLQLLSRSPIYSIMGETIQGYSSINSYNSANNFIQEFDNRLNTYLTCLYLQFNINRWLEIWLIISGSSILTLLGILIVWKKETITMASAGLILTYALQIVTGINFTVRLFSALETSMVALERIIEYTDSKPEAAWETDSKLALPVNWPSKGQIKFINYSTTYRDGLDLVLKNINLTFEPKSKIGVVGRTGAGKSSLILSLFRIIEPKGGSIVIDDVDITKIGLKDLRSRLTIIPQDPVLFSGTLRFNLDPWNDYSDEQLWSALEQAHLKAHFLNLGLDHEIIDGGLNLSTGQKQLVCLTRALLKRSLIVILDEATACVDNETDKLIQETIKICFSNSTVITVAHRLNTVIDSDKILVLCEGEVVEYDSPKVLMSSSESLFYKLADESGLISK